MKITLICVGRLKEAFWRDAAAEYLKRLPPYAKLEIIEVKDEATDREAESAMKKEADRVISNITKGTVKVALCVDGTRMTSQGFADFFAKNALAGRSDFLFIIGGSMGLHGSVLDACDLRLSFSDMTFPHQLTRVLLLEQIYRAMKLNAGEAYHK